MPKTVAIVFSRQSYLIKFESGSPEAETMLSGQIAGGNERILVVDDDEQLTYSISFKQICPKTSSFVIKIYIDSYIR